jgi:TolA-binding protein
MGVVSLLVFTACATKPSAKRHAVKIDPNEEKLIELTDQMEKQAKEMNRLHAAMEALNNKMSPGGRRAAARREARRRDPGDTADAKLGVTRKLLPPSLLAQGMDAEIADDLELADGSANDSIDAPEPRPAGTTVASSRHESMVDYYRGLQAMDEKRYDEAIGHFREFVRRNPNHVYADRAEFQIAEAHYLNHEYGLVIVETNQLEARYPFSVRAPEAAFQRALAHDGLGQREQARRALKDLMKKYPKSEFAARASRKLAELGPSAAYRPPLIQDAK